MLNQEFLNYKKCFKFWNSDSIITIEMLRYLLCLLIIAKINSKCVHDLFSQNTTKHFYHDLHQSQGRRLQTQNTGKLRIFADYTYLKVGGPSQINTIKRIVNITSMFFYNTLKVPRLQKLFFPTGVQPKCNILTVPNNYITEGTIGDLGVLISNQQNSQAIYVAKSSACAFLQSNKRPIWGMMQFNNAYLKFDQQGFQQILFVGIHQMTHILGFSASMYELYPNGNPLKSQQNGDNYLSSPRINEEVQKHFGCNHGKGLLLQDQDGTLIASHWERKVVGNQFMIASNKKGSFVSRFTLALLQSSGWYSEVDYSYAEKTTWGQNKGCNFFDIDNCQSEQFCEGKEFQCDWQGTAIGRCDADPFTGSCKVAKYFTNTVCVDENYQLKNLNSKLNAMERGGSNSKCFVSNFRENGLQPSRLNNRCYTSVCSFSGRHIFILVGSYILVCRTPGQTINAPLGMQGTLTCPGNFNNYCKNKLSCPFHCNKNGACINGECLCTGKTQLSPSCLDVSIYEAPIGSTGGLLNSLKQTKNYLFLQGQLQIPSKNATLQPTFTKFSINKKCFTGNVFDRVFGQCLPCKEVFNCRNCDQNGCISCDDGKAPFQGKCIAIYK